MAVNWLDGKRFEGDILYLSPAWLRIDQVLCHRTNRAHNLFHERAPGPLGASVKRPRGAETKSQLRRKRGWRTIEENNRF